MTHDPSDLAEQYADAENLNARIRLHQEYSTADRPWWPWVFDRLREAVDAAGVADDADLLEVGCGPGDLWAENADRVPDGWTVTNTDFSPGMVEEFCESTARLDVSPGGAAVAAAESLPVPDDRFDVVVANHMLYHVDLDRALPEIRRVLRPGGRLVATTNGEDNLAEFRAMLDEAGAVWTPSCENFSLQNGPPRLRDDFETVERFDYDAGLQVPDPEPLVAYAGSLPTMGDAEIQRFAELATDALRDGPLAIDKEQGALVATVEE